MLSNISSFKDFTRGGQTTLHFIRMFYQVFKYGISLGMFIFFSAFGWTLYSKTTAYDWYLLNEYVDANLKVLIHDNKVKHVVKDEKGVVYKVRAIDFINSPKSNYYVKRWGKLFWLSVKRSIISSASVLTAFLLYCVWYGRKQKATNKVIGQEAVEPTELTRLLKRKKKASDITLANIPLVKDSEVQHILLTGSTGVGKSVAIKELMDQVRTKGQRAIVYDIDGAFVPNYYRSEKDILLNPLDERSPAWNIWQECKDMADFDTAALSMMPEHLAGSDPFWIRSAHTIFSSAALQLAKKNKKKTKYLLDAIFDDDLERLTDLVAGTPAASLVSKEIEKTALSIKATLSTYCKSLLYLKEEAVNDLFSIRNWIESEKNDSWLFISCNTQKIGAIKPLLSIWLDVAAKSILSLSPANDRRLWFFLDELPSLHKLPSLMDALSRGRKFGACFVAAVQDVHQLHSVYGKNDAESLTSLFNTKLFYRTQEPSTAAWMSKIMGTLELIEKKENTSYGAHEMRDGVSVNQERRKDFVIKDSQFLELEDLQAYLRLPGNWPITKLQFKVKDRKANCEAFVPRELELTDTIALNNANKKVSETITTTESENKEITNTKTNNNNTLQKEAENSWSI